MPEFFKKMPPKKKGLWLSRVEVYTFRNREVVWEKQFKGLRRAYVAARLKAFWWDLWQPHWRGIDWFVIESK